MFCEEKEDYDMKCIGHYSVCTVCSKITTVMCMKFVFTGLKTLTCKWHFDALHKYKLTRTMPVQDCMSWTSNTCAS